MADFTGVFDEFCAVSEEDKAIADAAVKDRLELAARKCKITFRYPGNPASSSDEPGYNPFEFVAEWKLDCGSTAAGMAPTRGLAVQRMLACLRTMLSD